MLDRLYAIAEDPKNPPRWAARHIVAEDDGGGLYLPCRDREHKHDEPWWDRPLNLRNPLHWRFAALSALTGWMILVEAP